MGESVAELPKQDISEAAEKKAVEATEAKVVEQVQEHTAEIGDAAAPSPVSDMNVDEAGAAEAEDEAEATGNIAVDSRRPLFPRFKPRSAMVFNRNGFPRKNADLRIALSELQKTAEKPQSTEVKPESLNREANPEPQNEDPKPEGSKES